MNKRIIRFLPLVAVIAMTLSGCKPTERNYKAAYDAALGKRQGEERDPDLNLPAGGMQRIGMPGKKTIDGKEYYCQFLHLKPVDPSLSAGIYNVAVAVYNMPTNCDSQVNDLRGEGYEAWGARSPEDKYYVIAGSFDTAEEAAGFIDSYRSRYPESVYVGFESGPVIIRSR